MKLEKVSVGLLSLLLLASCGGGSNQGFGAVDDTPQEYKTLKVQETDVVLESVYPVTMKGQEDIEIRPRVDGFIDAIYVDEGSVVRQGQSLFKINSPQTEQAVTTARASVNSAQAQVNTAKLDVDRIRTLAEKGIVSQVQLSTKENIYQTTLAALAQAQAALKNAQETLSWTNVKSPVDGVVGNIPFRKGSLVNPANALTTVANTSNVFAYFSLNEKELLNFLNSLEGKTQAEKLKNTPNVTLTLADGSVYEDTGRIETIAGMVNVTTGSATFRAEFPNKHGYLRSGTSGKISIPRQLHNTIVIPQVVTSQQQDKIIVFKVQGDSVVQKVITVLPTADGKEYAVTDGLSSGDQIVSEGIMTLSHGKKIKAI